MAEQKTRKELVAEYKELKHPMGVYQIRNTENNKVYVAGSLNLRAAWNQEQFKLDGGLHMNAALQSDWKTFGKDKFAFEVLFELKLADDAADPRAQVKELETMTIEEVQPFGDRGYNIRKK
jgi:hypothetical protein